jgi:hypothetical protein
MPAARIKVEEFMEEDQDEEDVAVDRVDDDVNYKPWRKVAKKKSAKKTVIGNKHGEKNPSSPKKKKERLKAQEEDDDYVADEGEQLWMCKKNDGKTWFCRRTVSQPDSYCLYHSEPKRVPQLPSLAASKPSKRRRKRALDIAEGFYYYAGFGPSRSKRQCRPSSSVMESPSDELKEPDELQEQASAEENEEAPPEEHADLTTAQPQVDDADEPDHQVASARVDEPMCVDTVGIAGCDEESSDDAFAWNGEPRVVGANGGIKRKSPFKKRWRKPVKARSLKSLM